MKYLKQAIALLLVLTFIHTAEASHMVGADITYKCLDTLGNYKVTLVYYRDCSGLSVCGGSCTGISNCTKTMEVRSGDAATYGSLFFTFTVSGKSVRDANLNVNPNCIAGKNICGNMGCVTPGSLSPGIERYEFEGIVNLGLNSAIPANCCTILLDYSECCRNNISSIVGTPNFWTQATVNRCLATFPNCNSPIVSNDPYNLLCAGIGFFHNYGGFDPDMDSLAYSFTPALIGLGQSVTYNSPYSANVPMPYTPPLSLNYPYGIKIDSYGNLQFKPNAFPYTGIVAIKIEQWRKINGVNMVVGTTQRDVQMYINFCDFNNLPSLRTIPSGTPSTQPLIEHNVFADSTLCFTVIAKDTDFNYPTVSDTTYLRWDSVMLRFGATFMPDYIVNNRTTNGPREDTYKFCWTPNDTMVNDQPYRFIVTAFDSRCPRQGVRSQNFSIRVRSLVETIHIYQYRKCDSIRITHGNTQQTYLSKNWKISKTPDVFDTSNLIVSPQQTLNLKFDKPGRYPLRIEVTVATLGLSKIFYDTIVVPRLAKISRDTSFCSGNIPLSIKLEYPDSGFTKFRWYDLPDTSNAIDTSKTFTFLANASHSILLKAYDTSTTCFFADTFNVKLARLNAGIAMLTDSIQCNKNHKFLFKNLSIDSANNEVNFIWSFENGDTTTKKDSVAKSFLNIGLHQVKLLTFNSFGCKDSIIKNLMINPSPNLGFTFGTDSMQCLKGNQFSYLNQSHVTNDTLIYTWKMGNGNLLSTINTSESYSTPGLYSVKLIATTSNQCKDSITKQVKVFPNAKVGFKTNDTTQCFNGHSFKFTDTSSLSSGGFTRVWTFGDSTTSTFGTPTKSYSQIKPYQIQLVITTDKGCKDTAQGKVYTLLHPVAQFSINDSAQCFRSHQFAFMNQSFINNGDSLQYVWNFGDSTVSYAKDQQHIFTNIGVYSVKLVVKSNDNCGDSISNNVQVYEEPIAKFSLIDSIQCLIGNVFSPINQSSIGIGTMLFSWDFGDSTGSTLANANHSYTRLGYAIMKLKVSSDQGCLDSAEKLVQLNPNPKANFRILDSLDQCLRNNRFKFIDQSTVMNGTYTQKWYFGDGTFLVDTNPLKTYIAAGTYQVKLIATSNLNCMDSMAQTVYVLKTPNASFQMPDTTQCIGSLFSFNNTSSNVGDSIIEHIWSTGDSTIIHSKHAAYVYPLPGKYEAALIVVNKDSCYSIDVKHIEVYPKPKPLIVGDTLVMAYSAHTYSTAFNTGSSWNWMITNDSAHLASSNSILIDWSFHPNGIVAVSETSLNGCVSDTVTQNISISPLPIGIYETESNPANFLVYPQPADNKLFLLGDIQELRTAELISMEGKLIRAFNAEEISSGSLDVQMIQSGMYLLRFDSNRNQVWVQKVSVVKE